MEAVADWSKSDFPLTSLTLDNDSWYYPAFEISVVRAPGTTKKLAGQPKILKQLSDGQL